MTAALISSAKRMSNIREGIERAQAVTKEVMDVEGSFRILETPHCFFVEQLVTKTYGFLGRKKKQEWTALTYSGHVPSNLYYPVDWAHRYKTLAEAKRAARAFKRGHIIHAV